MGITQTINQAKGPGSYPQFPKQPDVSHNPVGAQTDPFKIMDSGDLIASSAQAKATTEQPRRSLPSSFFGIDESGMWRFKLLPSRSPYQSGLWMERQILLIRDHRAGASWGVYSVSWVSAQATRKIFATHARVFDTEQVLFVQLDGAVWRCVKEDASDGYVIHDRLRDA
ncbi:hypothetical protein TREMEDRAFT_70691 [Tremella mesenterica DSM 1558]|uniref:uncharacterized protein n=1 Tax=Tremella mesenterica (strain ATCC 24925 / CBS 8224 / DSM 1558 / NBRC 9311 / NRRL Y-6157 / RJB 2259-6 / UBC 559-6) TaxID=578456 RepID=UPI0003F4A0F7|nr:uncharacterized protein TREMEDRAFT_70691 [Tremella mesenterica DSM 1558]EIW72349.1 hypothetical protein TREMEDRAFT_70691 [Tremella mesenterica DSM 1558]